MNANPLLLACVAHLLLGCHRDQASPTPPAATASPSPVPAPPLLKDHASLALMTAGDAGSPHRIFIHRDGSAVWVFQQPGKLLLRLRGTLGADGSATVAGLGRGSDSLTLSARSNGTVEVRSVRPDGGVATAAALVENVPWARDVTTLDSGFDVLLGTIPARAQLHCEGDKVQGYYRYAKSQNDLTLSGIVDVKGHFFIDERTPTGAPTGKWEGIFLGPGGAAGIWSSPDGKRQLPFTMVAAPPLVPLAADEAELDEKTVEEDAGAGCTNTTTVARVSGLIPASRNALVNQALQKLLDDRDTVSCDGTEPNLPWFSEADVRVDAQAPGFLAVTSGGSSYSGGAHPIGGGSCTLLDTHTGQAASLLAILGPAVVERIQAQLQVDLTAFYHDNGLDPDDAGVQAPPLDDGVVCYVNPHELELRFSPYAVAPYAFGAPSFQVDMDPLLPLVPPSKARDALFTSRGD